MLNILSEGYFRTVEDILDGYVDNVPDKQIDQDLKMFSKFAKLLKCKWYTHLVVLIDDEGEYNPSNFEDSEVVESKAGWTFYNTNGISLVHEIKNGISFLYFGNEDDAENYKKLIDNYNKSEDEGSDEIITESYDEQTGEYSFQYSIFFNYDFDSDSIECDVAPEDEDEVIENLYYQGFNQFVQCVKDALSDNCVDFKRRLGINDYTLEYNGYDQYEEIIKTKFTCDSEISVERLSRLINEYCSECEVNSSLESSIFDSLNESSRSLMIEVKYTGSYVESYEEEDISTKTVTESFGEPYNYDFNYLITVYTGENCIPEYMDSDYPSQFDILYSECGHKFKDESEIKFSKLARDFNLGKYKLMLDNVNEINHCLEFQLSCENPIVDKTAFEKVINSEFNKISTYAEISAERVTNWGVSEYMDEITETEFFSLEMFTDVVVISNYYSD